MSKAMPHPLWRKGAYRRVRRQGLMRKRGKPGKQVERFEVLGACIGGLLHR
jgi:hypothetical protein